MDYNTSTSSFETEIVHWSNIARNNYFWKKEFSHKVRFNHDIRNGDVYQRWFEDGVTNMCYNCLDRHLSSNADRIAYYWEGNELDVARKMTYKELHEEVCKLTGILRSVFKVKKGMCVVVYLPMILLAPVVLLACARLGVVINVVFGGFSAQELSRRMIDSKAELIITVNGSYRGKKFIPFKQYVDEALEICDSQGLNIKCLVYNHVNSESVNMKEGRDYYASLIDVKPDDYIEWVRSEEPLFILYTSGSTGKPKGLVHVTGGYMVQAGYSFVNVFNYNHATDIFFCTADIGWITGHTYVIFGPLLNCATSVIYEGIPTYPTPARWWQIIDTYKVSTFYTAPTAIRTLMKEGTDWLVSTSRDSLHTVASVGEPLNPSAWEWYHEMVGKSKCRVLDTWFQTETGTIIITASTRNEQKPGISGRSIAGISVNMLDTNGREIVGSGEGFLVIRSPFPSQARTILGDHIQYVNTYFTRFPGYYNTADGCNRDCDGCYKITGRVDEVINVSGHRLGTGEIEGAVNSTPGVVESAVVPFSHCIKGEGIAVFVVRQNERISESDIKQQMRVSIGGLAVPDQLFFVPDLPKTRSGKILRHLLRKIYNENSNEVDCTTLANPDAVKSIQQELRNSRME